MLLVAEPRYASRLRQPRHAHDATTVTIIHGGTLRERVGTREEVARALSIVVKPRDTEHADEFGEGVRTLQIGIGGEHAAELQRWEAGLRQWRWQHGGPAVPAFLRLLRLRREYGAAREPVQRAAFDALAAVQALPVRRCDSGEPPRWLAIVRESLDDAPRPPRVRALADAAGVHPVYLARQFRRWYGCSITEHLERRRVQTAAVVIASSSATLSSIAHDTGFADQPHMCRSFARALGVTPGAYRVLSV